MIIVEESLKYEGLFWKTGELWLMICYDSVMQIHR